MRRPRSGIGAELAPLVLILACLAGSLALIVAVHRRAASRATARPSVAVALPPAPVRPEPPRPAPSPVTEPEPDEPEPPPPPAPEDPTPKVIAKLTSAEAEQLLEASRADRKAEALEAARKDAVAQSERWRRRESLVRLQLETLDTKVRKLETEVDELALERDALEKERDARKAMAARDRSRPSQAILPHRGQNGTWRRPIVVECSNGMAILRPQGIGFGLLDLASGFGPASNPFVATIAREAIRIQGNKSPDGQVVIPYIFFLVRPDGIRAYYEARGRLEPLGITFGYELADQDWEVDFPDLDDIKTWDGSGPSRPEGMDPLAPSPSRAPGSSPAEDEDFPPWASRAGNRSGRVDDIPGGEFTWPPRSRALAGGGTVFPGNRGESSTSSPGGGGAGMSDLGRSIDGEPGPLPGSRGPVKPLDFGNLNPPVGSSSDSEGRGTPPTPTPTRPGSRGPISLAGGPDPATSGPASTAEAPTGLPESATAPADPARSDPANTFVWPPKGGAGPRGAPGSRSGQPTVGDGSDLNDQSPPVRHTGPFSRPLAMGIDSIVSQNQNPPTSSTSPDDGDPSQPDGGSGTARSSASQARGGSAAGTSKNQGQAAHPSDAQGIGQGGTPNATPPPGTVGVGMPGSPPSGMTPPGSPPASPPDGPNRPPSLPEPSVSPIVDRRFEVVVVCSARGVIVMPGSYRVTADALKDRDGLLKKQVVALVKAKRSSDPKTIIEPKVRFLVQPGGNATYWAARSQFLLSGLDWPISTHFADPDHPSILPSESW